MSGDDFTRDKFTWLRQVAMDQRLPLGRGNLAIVFCGYLNRKDGTAWPSIDRIAGDLGIDRRNVQKTIAMFVECGHLKVEIGGGRKNTNRYMPILRTENLAKTPPFQKKQCDNAIL